MGTHCVVPVDETMLRTSSGFAVMCASNGSMENVSGSLQRELSISNSTNALLATITKGPEFERKEEWNLNVLEIGIRKQPGGRKPFWMQAFDMLRCL